MRLPTITLLLSACSLPLFAQEGEEQTPPAAHVALAEQIPWRSDGQEFYERDRHPKKVEVDRMALVDAACAEAKQRGTLVLWYVHRVQEKTLQGRQMYRAPVLDVYARQVLFSDPDVSELATHAFVPLRCVMDQALSDRFGLKPLAFIEPAVVFLDGDGNVVHWVERIRTFHGQWFADLCVRVLEHAKIARSGDSVDTLRQQGLWREALAMASKVEQKTAADWLAIARLQRLLRQPDQAKDSVKKARAAAAPAFAVAQPDEGRRRRPNREAQQVLGSADCEEGLLLAMTGHLLDAQPLLERAWRSSSERAAEAGYWYALDALRLGDEVGAMRRFQLVAQNHPDTLFGHRALANATLGPDDRPLGAAFTSFEALEYLPEAAYQGLPKDTEWQGDRMSPAAMARAGVEFLLRQQRDDGGFTDARYAYWPSSEITPNVWVAITAIALTALWEHREAHPDLQARIDRALQRGEAFILDPKRLNRGANEDCYSDAYRLMYLSRRANGSDEGARRQFVQRMNEIVQAAALRQKPSGFWAHEYENAFATGAVLQEVLAAKAAGATVPAEVTDKAAGALLSARYQTGSFSYGGSAGEGRPTGLKDASGRMPVCEGALFQVGRSDPDRLRFALDNFWQYMKNLEGVRRNDFHSDGELGGFFFFHAVFHASEVVRLLPEEEQAAHWQRFVALLQQIPEMDGSFLDSHEFGRSYGTAMALLTLRNATRQ
ncbi:MAG TPA: hypothetical protein VFZ65_20260 [Planctomycetota bacterium]|nr:hypothetical protein [Planctomycetota bacterium]